MPKTIKIQVQDKIISIIQNKKDDYICLTDMLKAKDGDFFMTDWLEIEIHLNF